MSDSTSSPRTRPYTPRFPLTLPPNLPSCVPGEKVPYPESPPPTITQNISYPFPIEVYPSWEVGLKSSTYAVAMVMAVFGNLLVIATVSFNRGMRNSTNYYLLNLAISDLMVGALNMWMHLVINITSQWPFDDVICKAFPFLQIMSLTASVLYMAVIAGERFLAIVFPLKARLSKPCQHAIVMLLVWGVAAAVAVPNILVRQLNQLFWKDFYEVWCYEKWPRYASENQGNSTECLYDYPGRQLYYNLQVVVMYLVPIVVMTVAYSIIIYKINHRHMPGEQTAGNLALQQRLTTKVVTMLVVVLIVFVICWTPQEIVVIMDANWPEYSSAHISEDLRYVFIFIAYFNSSLNPILYAVLNERFRQAIKELYNPCRQHRKRNKIYPAEEPSPPCGNGHHPTPVNGLQNNGLQNNGLQNNGLTIPPHDTSTTTQSSEPNTDIPAK